ncbi:DUF6988 family protein [Lysobacter sp. CA199]|uniref:DUF6988 family protein n=1 Tax=Lysobacter sp. CA199 TaxID=3455608 RepID=UPI003F8D6374
MTSAAVQVTLPEQVETSKRVCQWLAANTKTLSFNTTKRAKLACSSLLLALEHHEGLVELIGMGKVGAGLALSRSILDSYVLGLWIADIATPELLVDFVNDKFTFSLKKILPKLRDNSVFTLELTQDLEKLIDEMNGFTHGNMAQLQWRYSKQDIQPRYPEQLQVAMLRTASMFAFLSAYKYQTLANHIELRDRLLSEVNVRLGFIFAEIPSS